MASLMHAYYFYAAALAIKLLVLIPLASVSVCNREKIQRANLSDLKHLTPFWLVAGLYMTTSPDPELAINLMRVFAAARIIAALGYIKRLPRSATEGAFFVSFAITSFMGGSVVYKYRSSL